jgi:radical SAM superfamily enzyme YgiQ (UPF0313 family)
MQTAMDYARTVKQTNPDLKIITGGIHATTYPHEILKNCPDFDYIALGEGEPQMVAMANRMAAGELGNLKEIKSFAFRDQDGKVHVNQEREWINYEDLPCRHGTWLISPNSRWI